MRFKHRLAAVAMFSALLAGITAHPAAARIGSRQFVSTNRHATVRGTIEWTNRSITVRSSELTDFSRPGAPSYSCAYLTWQGTHKNRKQLGCTNDGSSSLVDGSFKTNKLPKGAQVTVCTRFGDDWECGRPS